MKKGYKFLMLVVVVLLLLVSYGYTKLTPSYTKIGETTFYKDEHIELKVVLIYENLPLHYVGNSYSVACRSQNTESSTTNDEFEWKTYRIEKGWDKIPDAYLGNGLGSDEAVLLQGLANEAKKQYLVKDSESLVILASPYVYISFDGCRTFRSWNLKDNISDAFVVESTPEFAQCVENQKKNVELGLASYGDCADLKFTGINQPAFSDVSANNNGHMSFKVTSPAFKDGMVFAFETSDFGKTWQRVTNE